MKPFVIPAKALEGIRLDAFLGVFGLAEVVRWEDLKRKYVPAVKGITRAMKIFDGNAKCVKCGGGDIHNVYHEAGWCESYDCKRRRGFHKHPERIYRRCERCNFVWYEKPLIVGVAVGE